MRHSDWLVASCKGSSTQLCDHAFELPLPLCGGGSYNSSLVTANEVMIETELSHYDRLMEAQYST